ISPSAVAATTFARFRFSTSGGLSYDGFAPDGEVEDYAVNIRPAVDLGVDIADAPDPVTALSNLTYVVVVTNQGPSTATGVMVTNTLPPSLTFLSATASQGNCNTTSNGIICSLGSLANGASATITLATRANAAGTFVATATVAGNEAETDPAD